MSEVTISNSPIHSDSIITYPYGVNDSSYSCGYHTGVDFAPYGRTETNPLLYSCINGTVVYINTDTNQALGVQAQILADNGTYFRYCHMVAGSLQVKVGDKVTTNSVLGRMGATGNVTGVHLHLEQSTTQAWICGNFLNPCDYLKIPNVDNTIIKYDGEKPPEPERPSRKKSKFKWVIYAKKLHNRY